MGRVLASKLLMTRVFYSDCSKKLSRCLLPNRLLQRLTGVNRSFGRPALWMRHVP